jgi:hypothetical protein
LSVPVEAADADGGDLAGRVEAEQQVVASPRGKTNLTT